jgi:CheY-like chemotaxis protein
MSQTDPTILLVEDNEDDVFIMKYALKQARVANPVQVVTDGQMALDYLAGTGIYSDRVRFPLPFIVFLDLKLPYVHGFEVLTWIGQQQGLSSLVVIVLTSSEQEKDQQQAYALGARSYLIKPPTADTLLDVFASLKSYWLSKTDALPVATDGGRTREQ